MDEKESIYVTAVRYSGGTTAEATGVIIEADMEVEFTGEVQPMRDLAEAVQTAIDAGGPLENYPVARVPSWAVTSRKPAGYFL
jgi:hypothetical protein